MTFYLIRSRRRLIELDDLHHLKNSLDGISFFICPSSSHQHRFMRTQLSRWRLYAEERLNTIWIGVEINSTSFFVDCLLLQQVPTYYTSSRAEGGEEDAIIFTERYFRVVDGIHGPTK